MAMDEQGRKISKKNYEEHEEKKNKKRRRRREEENKAELPLSHSEEISALSSATDDAAAKQKRKEKKAQKLLLLQKQDTSTGVDCVEEPSFDMDVRQGEALSPATDDAAAKQKRKEKKARKLLLLQKQDASTGSDCVEDPSFDMDSRQGKALSCAVDDVAAKQKRKEKKARKLLLQKQDASTGIDCVEEPSFEMDLRQGEAVSSAVDNAAAKQKRKEKKARKLLLQKQDASTGVDCDEEPSFNTGLRQGEALSSPTDDAAAKQKRKEKRARKLLLQKQDASTGVDCVEEPSYDVDLCQGEKDREKKREKKRKRVTFQDQICESGQEQVTDTLDKGRSENSNETVEEVWGVRFTPQEDEILKDAVWKYIKSKGWGEEEGLNKVFNSRKHKDAHNCWADIKMSLPHRPRATVRFRARILLERGAHLGKWSAEEEVLLKRLQGKHGRKWREISHLIERHRTSLKEKWRSLKRSKAKGVWTQDELQQLADMVHKCLRVQASLGVDNKNPTHQHLRDNINWEKIADTIGTHSHGSCCSKWYDNLQSALVSDGHWMNEDDGLLLKSLLESEACTEEEVEWDSLLDHRSGQLCSTRWKQMTKHLGENRTRQFLDKLDILARRYAPQLLEISVDDTSNKENPSGSPKISS